MEVCKNLVIQTQDSLTKHQLIATDTPFSAVVNPPSLIAEFILEISVL